MASLAEILDRIAESNSIRLRWECSRADGEVPSTVPAQWEARYRQDCSATHAFMSEQTAQQQTFIRGLLRHEDMRGKMDLLRRLQQAEDEFVDGAHRWISDRSPQNLLPPINTTQLVERLLALLE
jgi:hypothetical protein